MGMAYMCGSVARPESRLCSWTAPSSERCWSSCFAWTVYAVMDLIPVVKGDKRPQFGLDGKKKKKYEVTDTIGRVYVRTNRGEGGGARMVGEHTFFLRVASHI